MRDTMRSFLILIALVGCGGDGHQAIDAAVDAEVAALDCATYCAKVQSNCIGANAQYADLSSCQATCRSFSVETSSVNDTSGNTLGCRIHYAVDASKAMAATADCAYAGPAGDLITTSSAMSCSGGDVCMSFCILEIKACGSLDIPLSGDPRDADGNPLFQYRNIADCMNSCGLLDKTHGYTTTAAGDSLACRLLHATIAASSASSAATDCSSTAEAAREHCAGVATP
jgi:hypothetical protein